MEKKTPQNYFPAVQAQNKEWSLLIPKMFQCKEQNKRWREKGCFHTDYCAWHEWEVVREVTVSVWFK